MEKVSIIVSILQSGPSRRMALLPTVALGSAKSSPERKFSASLPSSRAASTQRDAHLRCIAEPAAWVGRKPQDTTGVPWWSPISRAGSASSVMGFIRKRTGDRRPR
jgi:hypothetical protein